MIPRALLKCGRWLRRTARDSRDHAAEFLTRHRANDPAILRIVAGSGPAGARHAIYVHYDRRGEVHGYVRHAVAQLAANGYAVTFVSNSPSLADEEIAALLPLVREIVHRRNVGYDFGAYRDGLVRLPDLDQVERLILTNDSVYGPLFPLAETLEAAESKSVDAFAITDSFQISYHLQSYFLLFFPRAIGSAMFRQFWDGLQSSSVKSRVVRQGEVELSRNLIESGLKLAVLCPYADVVAAGLRAWPETAADRSSDDQFHAEVRRKMAKGKSLNPTHFFWQTLIVDFRCPFVKRDLIRDNPAEIPDVDLWKPVIAAASDYATSLIEDHLGRESRR